MNKELKDIESTIYEITVDYYSAPHKLLETWETVIESYTFLQSECDDIRDTITFHRLKITHSSIITNLLLPITFSNFTVFFLKITLMQAENYILFKLFPIPIVDNRTGLQYIMFTA